MICTEIRLQWTSWPSVTLVINCERPLRSEQLHDVANLAASIEDMRERVQFPDAESLAP